MSTALSASAGFDNSTLAWVSDEINLALQQAGEALARHVAAPAEAAPLVAARNHLHQACGALTIVGLAGVSHFTESIEARLAALDGSNSVAVAAAAGNALAALRRHLDLLMAGHPDQPLRLYPAYRALLLAAHQPEPSPLTLFHPDLTQRPPRRAGDVTTLALPRAKALRLGFARGLAKWLEGEARGRVEMRNAVVQVEQCRAEPAERALWWVARAWFELDAGNDALLGLLDQQFEQLAHGRPDADVAPPELLAGLLYDIALAPPGDALRESVRAAYRLMALIPETETTVETRREICRAPLGTAMSEWEAFSRGSVIALMRFHDVAQLLAASARDSQDVALARLVAAVVDFAAWLRRQPERADAVMALEVAGALVLVEDAIEQEGARSPVDAPLFATAVNTVCARLDGLKQGALPPAERQRWREQLIVAQVAGEAQANLDAAEAALDAYFQAPGGAAPSSVLRQLHEVGGALRLLGEEDAARCCADIESRIAACTTAADGATFAAIAERLTALAQFVRSLLGPQPERALLAAYVATESVPADNPLGTSTVAVEIPPPADTVSIGSHTLSATLYRLYVDEAQSHITALRQELAESSGVPSRALIRAAHTLAGISAGTGFARVQVLAHALENTLVRHSLARAAPDESGRLLLARAVGALEGMVGAIAERRPPADENGLTAALDALELPRPEVPLQPATPLSPLAERRQSRPADEIDPQLAALFLEEAEDYLRQLDEGLRAWRAAPGDTDIGHRMTRLLHTFKGSARMCGAMGLGELAHGMEARIEQALVGAGADAAVLDSLDVALGRAGQLVAELQPQAGAPTTAQLEVPAAPAAVSPTVTDGPAVMLRLRADLVDQLVGEAGEMAIARSRIEGSMKTVKGALLDLTDNIARLRGQLREFEIIAETGMQSRLGGGATEGFDPLELDRFTRLQELARMMTESVSDVAMVQSALLRQTDAAGEALAAQSRQNRSLSHTLLRARMVPFNTVAERLHRVVRQTAKELGKQANLDLAGGDTPVDRNVLERMLGPLEHLLRNAVAHGIETPELRRVTGKPDLGQIALCIEAGENDIALTLTDDGQGLDLAAIRQRAIERNVLRAEAAVDEETLTDLIFRPGFSTAATVNEIAGRGVGLDVVRSEVDHLGGHITLSGQPGAGTRFAIMLPLTLAVIPVMRVRAAGRHWAIPATLVEEAQELGATELASRRAAGGVTRNGQHYPWHTLTALYRLPADGAERGWQLLLKSGGTQIALEVAELMQNQEVVVKPLGDMLARVPGLTGATVLADGAVALIVNPVTLAERMRHVAPPTPESVASPSTFGHAQQAPTVMVVDDSLTVRKITSRLLERAGYRVMLAKDGVDALEQLRVARPAAHPAVLLADIEMPRMDGFALVRALRDDALLAALPVIMISSRSAERHRQIAAELGVRHYLGKPYDEIALLDLIAALITAG